MYVSQYVLINTLVPVKELSCTIIYTICGGVTKITFKARVENRIGVANQLPSEPWWCEFTSSLPSCRMWTLDNLNFQNSLDTPANILIHIAEPLMCGVKGQV